MLLDQQSRPGADAQSALRDYTGVIGFFLHSFPPVEFASAIHHALC
jgi:hypothetical protein